MNYKEIKKDKEIKAYIQKGNEKLGAMGYTDHSENIVGLWQSGQV